MLGLEEIRRIGGTEDTLRGLLFILVGDASSGKALLTKKIIRPLLGGRECRPFKFMLGEDNFNDEMDTVSANRTAAADSVPEGTLLN